MPEAPVSSCRSHGSTHVGVGVPPSIIFFAKFEFIILRSES